MAFKTDFPGFLVFPHPLKVDGLTTESFVPHVESRELRNLEMEKLQVKWSGKNYNDEFTAYIIC